MRDEENSFLRTAFQTKLVGLPPDLLVSAHDNCMTRLVGFIKEIVQSFTSMNACFSSEYLSTSSMKKLRRDLRDTISPVSLYNPNIAENRVGMYFLG